MPIPFIPLLLGGAALLAGGVGVAKGLEAKEDLDRAKRITERAQETFEKAKTRLEDMREETQEQLEKLGEVKRDIYEKMLLRFVESFDKIKNVEFKSNLTDDELVLDKVGFTEIRETTLRMTDYLGSAAASLTGGALAGLGAFGGAGLLASASTGVAISTLSGVAATNATLAWFGGGALAAGGMGMAGGMAVLGGVVAAPVLLVGGLIMASKAEAAKYDAYANLDKAEAAAEDMKIARSAARAIRRRTEEIHGILNQFIDPFTDLLDDLEDLVEDKVDYGTYSEQERKLVSVTGAYAKTVKNIVDTPIFDEEGRVTKASKAMLAGAQKSLIELANM
ncbi:hypothetical protein [Desulfovibrio intestinalis]|uniref:Chemotaxis protein n=1 Tax=Desulfovibrio intestinalis TaxID=58621 RepID=A0A7W8C5V2_9BACT|nr:hypothetical protein [Desulfovibrio intestinalis]MBB5144330.1 hypothetical protein [Desulfovibrio intestinalis]